MILFLFMNIVSITQADNVQAPSGPYRSLTVDQGMMVSGFNADPTGEKSKITANAQQVSPSVGAEESALRHAINQQNLYSQSQYPPAYRAAPMYTQQDAHLWYRQQQENELKRLQGVNNQYQINQHQAKIQVWNKQQGAFKGTEAFPALEADSTQPANNRSQHYFPAARGQVYGPPNIPPEYYLNPSQQAVNQARRPVHQYRPMWK